MDIQALLEIYYKQRSVSTDTRKIKAGDIFFALKGDHFDGNQFVQAALDSGAAYVVCTEAFQADDERIIIVENTLDALQDLAKAYRNTLNIPVFGITGTNGKTTTKELLANVISTKYNVCYTQGNLNNHIGVPLTVLSIKPNHQFSIIEMGANHVGEIAALCEICQPTHGLITNVGMAHLEGFGNLGNIYQTKNELYQYLQIHQGVCMVNEDEPSLELLIHSKAYNWYKYGLESLRMLDIDLKPNHDQEHLGFELNGTKHLTHLIGAYNFNNILTCFYVGQFFGIPNPLIVDAITNYQPNNNRSQLKEIAGVRFILDAYNANPTSVAIALDNLNHMKFTHKAVILGDMLELGDRSKELHNEVLMKLTKFDFAPVYLVGPIYYSLKDFYPEFLFFKTSLDLQGSIDLAKLKDFLVLIKGSRGVKLESIFQ